MQNTQFNHMYYHNVHNNFVAFYKHTYKPVVIYNKFVICDRILEKSPVMHKDKYYIIQLFNEEMHGAASM